MKKTALLLAAILVLGLAASAQADMYVGLYGGFSNIMDTDVTVDHEKVATNVEYDAGATVGTKVGYWLKSLPWLAAEFNAWNTWSGMKGESGENVSVTATSFSGSLLAQYLCDPWRLYVGGGVLGTWITYDSDYESQDDDGFVVGAMAQAGVEYQFLPNWGAFGEYRYIWNDSYEVDGASLDLIRHDFVAGINFRFM